MAKITRTEALRHYAQICGPVRKASALKTIEDYLDWGGTSEDSSLKAYLAKLTREGYKIGTVDLARRRIRAFWHALGLHVPRANLDFDLMQDSARPALSHQLMEQLRDAALGGQLEPYAAALTIIGVTYGLRVSELAKIQPQDVDCEGQRFYVRPSKNGVARWLWMPLAIRPLLDIDWPEVSAAHVGGQFDAIWATVIGTERPPGIAWHSVRRALVRDLSAAGIPDDDVNRFMRWRVGTRQAGPRVLYANPNQTIGEEATGPGTGDQSPRDIDSRVWSLHPYFPGDDRLTPDGETPQRHG